MLHATLNDCQTPFWLANPVHFSSAQDDQRITNPNPNFPNENLSTQKPRGRPVKNKNLLKVGHICCELFPVYQ